MLCNPHNNARPRVGFRSLLINKTSQATDCPESAGWFVVSMKRKEKIMCPVCISAMAVIVAGATSTGGLTALVVKKLNPKGGGKKMARQTNSKEGSL
jgi:hypothetical protein